jgi:hypothetical protein
LKKRDKRETVCNEERYANIGVRFVLNNMSAMKRFDQRWPTLSD